MFTDDISYEPCHRLDLKTPTHKPELNGTELELNQKTRLEQVDIFSPTRWNCDIRGRCSRLASYAFVFLGLIVILVSTFSQVVVAQQDVINDPDYHQQYHLENTGQNNGVAGEDINVREVWNKYKGKGVFIAIVDETLDFQHNDLKDNIDPRFNTSYDPNTSDITHATGVAGILAARDNNIGIRGVAPRASIFNLNAIGSYSEAAVTYATSLMDTGARQVTAVSNNSWANLFPFLLTGGAMWQSAIDTGLREGFHGKGIVYVYAAGNGFCRGGCDNRHNSNLSANANYHPIITVCSVDNRGVRASQSQIGANLWICAPGVDIRTTAPGNSYTSEFTGTSAATPMVSGVAALMRQANPNLTWRDVRLILANSARKNDSSDDGWATGGRKYNSNGRYQFNHQYGFGVVDAKAAVDMAENWTNLPPRTSIIDVNSFGLQNASAGRGSLSVQSDMDFIEHVEIRMFFPSVPSFHDLSVKLKSPSGIVSELAIPSDQSTQTVSREWHFGSSAHLGEDPSGTWTMEITNEKNPGQIGDVRFLEWRLRIRGFQSRMEVSLNKTLTNFNAGSVRITSHLFGAQWTTTLSPVHFKLQDAPPAFSIAEVNRISDVKAELILAFDKEQRIEQNYQNFRIQATTASIAVRSKSYVSDDIPILFVKESCEATFSMHSDDTLRESSLNGSELILNLHDTIWPDPLEVTDFGLNGVNGLSVASVSRTSDTEVGLTLAFSRDAETDDLDFDEDVELSVVIEESSFADCDVPVESNALTVIANPNPMIIAEEILMPQCAVDRICPTITLPNIFKISDGSDDFSVHFDFGVNESVFELSHTIFNDNGNKGLRMNFRSLPSVAGTYEIGFSVITPNNGEIQDSVSTTFEFEIRPAGFPIAVFPIPNQVLRIGETFTHNLWQVFIDSDTLNSGGVNYTLLEDPTLPSWISIENSVLNASVPDQASESGEYRIGISATDKDGQSTDLYFRLTVVVNIFLQLRILLEGLLE